MNFILFALGFILLIRGADYLVDGATTLARKFHISSIVIGLTIVSFGTSLPEMIVNINASLAGNAGLAIGNIIGSNIANILLVLGVTALVFPLDVNKSTTFYEIPFSFIITVLLLLFVNLHVFSNNLFPGLSRPAGIAFLVLQLAFMIYVFKMPKEDMLEEEEEEMNTGLNEKLRAVLSKTARATRSTKMLDKVNYAFDNNPVMRSTILIIIGLVGLVIGGKWTVDGAAGFADDMGVSEELIGYTVVAVGTCLPELITSVVAALKKNVDIAVGNVVGSLIFNILWVLGLSATIHPLSFAGAVNNNIDILILMGSTALLFIFVGVNSKFVISRFEGSIFLILYIGYIIYLIIRG